MYYCAFKTLACSHGESAGWRALPSIALASYIEALAEHLRGAALRGRAVFLVRIERVAAAALRALHLPSVRDQRKRGCVTFRESVTAKAFQLFEVNSQPMGFYAPAQIVRDAIQHGIIVQPVCINASRWDCTLEPTSDERRFAVRLGMRMVKGLANAHAAAIVAARADTPVASVDDLWRRASIPQKALVQLDEADAFRPTLGLARRE